MTRSLPYLAGAVEILSLTTLALVCTVLPAFFPRQYIAVQNWMLIKGGSKKRVGPEILPGSTRVLYGVISVPLFVVVALQIAALLWEAVHSMRAFGIAWK